MNEFTASNGIVFRLHEDGSWRWISGLRPAKVTAALRELFRAERDTELGRWRWPENPDYVVYRFSERRSVRVLRESGAQHFDYTDNGAWSTVPSDYEAAARAYFDAHPVRKPWHDAKPGEVWVIRLRGEDDERAVLVETFQDTRVFQVADAESITVTRDDVESARRIWPEEGAS